MPKREKVCGDTGSLHGWAVCGKIDKIMVERYTSMKIEIMGVRFDNVTMAEALEGCLRDGTPLGEHFDAVFG